MSTLKGSERTQHILKVQLSLRLLPSQSELPLLGLPGPGGGGEGHCLGLRLHLPLLGHHLRPQQCLHVDGQVSPRMKNQFEVAKWSVLKQLCVIY